MLSLPDAPPRRWTQPREGIARGKITETRITSTLLGNERRLWVYTPPGYRARGSRYPLLVLFDGWEYLHWIPTPTILDNLLADGLIPPLVAVLVDTVPWRGELACYPPFGSFMTKELLPVVAPAIPRDGGSPADNPCRFQPRGPRSNVLRVREPTNLWKSLVTVRLILVAAATPLAKAGRE